MPMPVSRHFDADRPAFGGARTSMRPPSGVNLTAFDSRFHSDLLQPRRIGEHVDVRTCQRVSTRRMPLASAAGRMLLERGLERRHQRQRLELELQLAGRHPRHVDEIVDELRLGLGVAIDQLRARAAACASLRWSASSIRVQPRMTLSGVRSSCDSVARNSSFRRFDSRSAALGPLVRQVGHHDGHGPDVVDGQRDRGELRRVDRAGRGRELEFARETSPHRAGARSRRPIIRRRRSLPNVPRGDALGRAADQLGEAAGCSRGWCRRRRASARLRASARPSGGMAGRRCAGCRPARRRALHDQRLDVPIADRVDRVLGFAAGAGAGAARRAGAAWPRRRRFIAHSSALRAGCPARPARAARRTCRRSTGAAATAGA